MRRRELEEKIAKVELELDQLNGELKELNKAECGKDTSGDYVVYFGEGRYFIGKIPVFLAQFEGQTLVVEARPSSTFLITSKSSIFTIDSVPLTKALEHMSMGAEVMGSIPIGLPKLTIMLI